MLNKNAEEEFSQMANLFARFLKDESGATAIEYGLLAALIAVAIIGGATTLGGNINAKLTSVAGSIAGN
ncbi:components of type IV pilus, pilin subunit [Nitratireductor aquibiodomus RA22]|uniref:Components of type IV pilus, pilin subunit n=2 Tax=Nitratireductor aquibiodomus TaxID=204799 RepID=I5BQY0_9HYPH|nr:components of type IV pilus, pilin subunit [Nitratireductor aquibiodomus RA22]